MEGIRTGPPMEVRDLRNGTAGRFVVVYGVVRTVAEDRDAVLFCGFVADNVEGI
jgi:hypothetical protein